MTTDSRFLRLEQAFRENFDQHGEVGASVSVYRAGREIFSLHAGKTAHNKSDDWTARTLVPIFSATKGPSSVCVLTALHQAGLTPETPMRRFWPQFPLPDATVAQVLSHQCGLAALDHPVDIHDHAAVVDAINHQSPAWFPPDHGYHARMFGPLAEEIVRLLTSTKLGDYWEQTFRRPLSLDLWIGLPESEFSRVAHLYPGRAKIGELSTPFYKDYMTEGTFIRRAFTSPVGYLTVQEMNRPDAWIAALPALGGISTASALAAFYQACLGTPEHGSPDTIPAPVRSWMINTQADGMDKLLQTETAFSCGFMKDPLNAEGQKLRLLFGPHKEAFGHPGAGGSIGLADPLTGLSFAYTMNQMELGVLPAAKTHRLLDSYFSETI